MHTGKRRRKTIRLRIPPRFHLPMDFRDCAPVPNPFASRVANFIMYHEMGYRWRPRLRVWFVPNRPAWKYNVKVVGGVP